MQTLTLDKPINQVKKETPQRIWSFSIDTYNYTEYGFPNPNDVDFFKHLVVPCIAKGKPLSEMWKPLICLKKIQKRNTDFIRLEQAGIAMSKKAVEALYPLIKDKVEFLPLRVLKNNLFVFVNILETIDGLDEEKSRFEYSVVSKTKIGINRYVFNPDKIQDKPIFKLKYNWHNLFVSDEFRAIYEANDLNGLSFIQNKLLWQQKYN